jgi:hypothetical protein
MNAMQRNQPNAQSNGWHTVSAVELTQLEGGLFGISWQDVKNAVRYVARVIHTVLNPKPQ